MKKYNLSKIMKRAWELVKKAGMTISSGLKKAWKEAKNQMEEILKFRVYKDEIFTVNTVTGEITGKTYNAKKFIKDKFEAKWNPVEKKWVADAEALREELTKWSEYYKHYIVKDADAETTETTKDEIVEKELVNRRDGFYSKITYASGRGV